MSTTDTRSGFRLPWSSDRSRDDDPQSTPDEAATAPVGADETVAPVVAEAPEDAWPEVDVAARLRVDPAGEAPARIHEAGPGGSPFAAPPSALPTAARKPSKLMAELVTAMRSTAEVAREQALSQVEAESRQVVEGIRKGATEGAAALRRQSDEDISGIREWSKAEIARIREQTDLRIAERKATLEAQVAEHTAGVDRRVEEVNAAVAAYETELAGFFERLLAEADPARLATMAEAMPEPPSLGEFATSPAEPVAAEATDWEVENVAAGDAAGVATDTFDTGGGWDTGDQAGIAAEASGPAVDGSEIAAAESAAEAPADVAPEPAQDPGPRGGPWGNEDGTPTAFAARPWGDPDGSFETAEPVDRSADHDVPRWVAGTDDDHPMDPGATPGAPVDRGSIMAALEAAAEAVVAAEAAAESADQAEAAADVAETAAELIVGRVDSEEEDHEAEAALAARMDAGGLDREPSLADRLASLLPGAGSSEDATPITTQVVVTGLVSVASIASFKRHLGRAHGVQSVTVASGPDGEFVFNVTHRGDSGLRDAIPALPGFAARVTGTGEGVLNVAARDPETEV